MKNYDREIKRKRLTKTDFQRYLSGIGCPQEDMKENGGSCSPTSQKNYGQWLRRIQYMEKGEGIIMKRLPIKRMYINSRRKSGKVQIAYGNIYSGRVILGDVTYELAECLCNIYCQSPERARKHFAAATTAYTKWKHEVDTFGLSTPLMNRIMATILNGGK